MKAGETVSGLQGIKKNPAKPSPAAMRLLAERLTLIEATGVLGMDLQWLNRNYQRPLFRYVRNCSAHRLRDLALPRRRTALVCFLRQSYRDGVDQAVDMFDKLLTRTFAHGRARSGPASARTAQDHSFRALCLCGPWARSSWGLSRNGVKNYSKGPCVTILE